MTQFYNDSQARKYAQNSRIIEIQKSMSRRAAELLLLPKPEDSDFEPMLILDVGCGSGLSGEVMSELGHIWVGIDVSPHMICMFRAVRKL
mgnify:CR=1 FL=1